MAEQFKTYPEAIEFHVTNGLGYRGLHQEESFDALISSWRLGEDTVGLYAHLGMMDYIVKQKLMDQESRDYLNAANYFQEARRFQRVVTDPVQFNTPEKIDQLLEPIVSRFYLLRILSRYEERARQDLKKEALRNREAWRNLENRDSLRAVRVYGDADSTRGIKFIKWDPVSGKFQKMTKVNFLPNKN